MKTITIRSNAELLLSSLMTSYAFFKTRPNNLVHDPESGDSDLPACAIYFEEATPDEDYSDVVTWRGSLHVELFRAQSDDVDDVLECDASIIIDALMASDLSGSVENIRTPKFSYNRDPETDLTALDLTFTLQWEE